MIPSPPQPANRHAAGACQSGRMGAKLGACSVVRDRSSLVFIRSHASTQPRSNTPALFPITRALAPHLFDVCVDSCHHPCNLVRNLDTGAEVAEYDEAMSLGHSISLRLARATRRYVRHLPNSSHFPRETFAPANARPPAAPSRGRQRARSSLAPSSNATTVGIAWRLLWRA